MIPVDFKMVPVDIFRSSRTKPSIRLLTIQILKWFGWIEHSFVGVENFSQMIVDRFRCQKLLTLRTVHEVNKKCGERKTHKMNIFVLRRFSTCNADHSVDLFWWTLEKNSTFRNFTDGSFKRKTELSITLYGFFESNYLWDEDLTIHDWFQYTFLPIIEELFDFSKWHTISTSVLLWDGGLLYLYLFYC